MMIKNNIVSSLCLSVLMKIASAQMMVAYPYDLGNYVDYRQDLAGDILSYRQELAQNMIGDFVPASPLFSGPGIAHPFVDLNGGLNGVGAPMINIQVDPVQSAQTQQTVAASSIQSQSSPDSQTSSNVGGTVQAETSVKQPSPEAATNKQHPSGFSITAKVSSVLNNKASNIAPKQISQQAFKQFRMVNPRNGFRSQV